MLGRRGLVLLFAIGLAACGSDAGAAGGAGASASQGGAGASGVGGLAAGSGGNAGRAAGGSGASGGGRGGSGGGSGSGGAASGGSGGRAGSGGSGSGAAGGGGSAGTDRAAFFGESRCAAAQLWLCEDFESGSIDLQRWKAMAQLPAIDTVHAARGQKALHVSTSATGSSGIETTKIFPTPDEKYWGRMFVWFEKLPTQPTWAHWTIVGANPASDSPIKGEVRIGGQFDGKLDRFGVGTDRGPTGDWTNLDADPKQALPVPEGSWICLEWLHDGANDQTRFFWDGVEHPSLATTRDTKHQGNAGPYELPKIGSIWFGFWNYDQGQTVSPTKFETWIDEIALDANRVGCTR